jgi:RND family efflux transporter MFP subunit
MTLASFIDSAFHLLARASLEGSIVLAAAILLASLSRTGRIKSWWHRLAHLKLFLALLCITPLTLPLLPAKSPQTPSIRTPIAFPADFLPINTTDERPPPQAARGNVLEARKLEKNAPAAILFTLWLLGALLTTAYLARSCLKIRVLLRRATLSQTRSLSAVAAALAQTLHLRTTPRIFLSAETTSPFLTGLLHPAIILPEHLATTTSPRTLELVITHELAHLARRDLWWNLLPAALSIPFFFHPLLWLARREWLAAQEIACDQLTLAATNASPADYARTLLDIVTRTSRPGLFAAGIGTFSTTKRRIKAMSYLPSKPTLSVIALALATALGLIPWKLVAQPTPATPQSAPVSPPADAPGATSLTDNQRRELFGLVKKLNDEKAALTAQLAELLAERQALSAKFAAATSDDSQSKSQLEEAANDLVHKQQTLVQALDKIQKLIDSTAREMDASHPANPDTIQKMRLALGEAQAANLVSQTARYAASIDARTVNLAPAVDGVVKTVNAAEGQHVKEGDVLFMLDRSDQANALALAELEVKTAKIAYERASAAAQTAGVSVAERDEAQAALERAQIALDKARIDFDKFTVRSPIDGIVSRSDLAPGQFAAKGAPVVTIVDTSHLSVTFYLPQPQSRLLHVGQKLTVTARNDAADSFDAEVIFVAPTIDTSTGTCRVRARIESNSDELKPGMFVTVAIPPA